MADDAHRVAVIGRAPGPTAATFPCEGVRSRSGNACRHGLDPQVCPLIAGGRLSRTFRKRIRLRNGHVGTAAAHRMLWWSFGLRDANGRAVVRPSPLLARTMDPWSGVRMKARTCRDELGVAQSWGAGPEVLFLSNPLADPVSWSAEARASLLPLGYQVTRFEHRSAGLDWGSAVKTVHEFVARRRNRWL